MLPPIKSILDPKGVHRAKLTAERTVAAKARPDAARHAAALFVKHIPMDENSVVALYHPIRDELDTEPLFDALQDRGVTVALPVTPKKPMALTFRAFAHGDPLIKGRHGVMAPSPEAMVVSPTIIVVPLLGFTRHGDRLGYGGGYYDRTIAEHRQSPLRPLIVGFAFGAQEVDALPSTPLDQPLDWIVTERDATKTKHACTP